MKRTINNRHADAHIVGVIVGLVVLIVILTMSFTVRYFESAAQASVKHTLKVKTDISSILSLIKDAETGQRGFLLTGKNKYLKPYHQAINSIDANLTKLTKTTQNNPLQQKNIMQLRMLSNQKMAELKQTIFLYKQGKKQEANALVNTDEGQAFMDNIRLIAANMTALEEALLLEKQHKLNTVSRFSLLSEFMVLIIFFALLYYARTSYLLTREIRSSEARLNNLLQATTNGIISVDETLVIQSVNLLAQNIFGYSNVEMVGKPLNMLIPQKHHASHKKDAESYIRDGKNQAMAIGRHVYGIRKNGEKIALEIGLSKIKLDNGSAQIVATISDITERKEAESLRLALLEKLSQVNELNRAILASSNHLIISTDSQGIVTQFNAASEMQLGYKASDIVGNKTPALWHDITEVVERSAKLTKELGELIEPGFDVFVVKPRKYGPERQEWSFIRKDGTRFLGGLTVTCIRDEDQKIMGYLGIIEDITERKRAENALHESKQFMKLIFDNSPSLIFVKDENLKIIEANKQFLDLYPETERTKVLGHYSFEGFDDDEAKELQKYDRIAFNEGYSAVTETLQFPNGIQRTMYTQKVRFKDIKNKRFILGIANDITEYESELLLLQKMHSIFSDTDLSFTEKIKNLLREGCRYYGLSLGIVSEIQGVQYRIFSASNNELIKPHETLNLEETYCAITYQKDEPFYSHDFSQSEFNSYPCYEIFQLNSYIGCKIMVNNIAFGTVNFSGAEKRDKNFSHREVAMLKHIAQWIGFNITQEKHLREKNTLIEKLSDSNKELEQFAYVASHDLKEPIRTLKTFTGHLIKDVEAGKQERVDQDKLFIDSACERMTHLIDDLLQLSRVGNTEYRLALCDFNSLVEDVLATLDVRIKETHAKIRVENNSVALYADKNQLGLALQNLIQNALKFHKPNEAPDISIRAVQEHSVIKLIVSDKGIGVSKGQEDKIFGIFKKLHTVSEYAGTGIGLAVVSKIMARHQGSVTIESEENVGASFTLNLPVMQD